MINEWDLNPTALRKAKIAHNFGLSQCNRVKHMDNLGHWKLGLFSFWVNTLIHQSSEFQALINDVNLTANSVGPASIGAV